MDDSKPAIKSKRLTKQPPPTSPPIAGMNSNTYAHLQRHPSTSSSPASTHQRDSHEQYPQRTPTSSNSSLDRSPNPPSSQYATGPPLESYNARQQQYQTRPSFDDPVPEPHPGVLSSLDSTKASGYQNSLRRPGPPPLSHTTPNAKMMSPTVRHSSSFSIGDRSVNTTPSDSESSISRSKRYSDEASGGKTSTALKKKSGISSFIGSVLGSPRNNSVKISAPENPVHVTHVGFDNNTGQFTVSSSGQARALALQQIWKLQQEAFCNESCSPPSMPCVILIKLHEYDTNN